MNTYNYDVTETAMLMLSAYEMNYDLKGGRAEYRSMWARLCDEWRKGVGSGQLRYDMIELAEKISLASKDAEKHAEYLWDRIFSKGECHAWDFDVIPHLLELIASKHKEWPTDVHMLVKNELLRLAGKEAA